MKKSRVIKKKKMRSRIFTMSNLLVVLFLCSAAFFVATRTMLTVKNNTLAEQELSTSQELEAAKSTVSRLETEVNELKEKSNVLGQLGDDVTDNQSNVYVIDVDE